MINTIIVMSVIEMISSVTQTILDISNIYITLIITITNIPVKNIKNTKVNIIMVKIRKAGAEKAN